MTLILRVVFVILNVSHLRFMGSKQFIVASLSSSNPFCIKIITNKDTFQHGKLKLNSITSTKEKEAASWQAPYLYPLDLISFLRGNFNVIRPIPIKPVSPKRHLNCSGCSLFIIIPSKTNSNSRISAPWIGSTWAFPNEKLS
jgi:hypothetical protein